ncbi:MAG TPA: alpha/beta hydrolase, partial [Wenzhouxiangella sp.]|nr:alpha/beta hydrolase [Wenzhouxiangella sp.]
RITLVTNTTPDSRSVEAREYAAGGMLGQRPLDLSWPQDVYSLSHVALTFPENDPLYGASPTSESPGISLGKVALRGERGVLQISDSTMLRQHWNPFYPYLEERMLQFFDL